MNGPLPTDPPQKNGHLSRLMRMARRAAPDVDRVSDEHGHSARIERDPEVPGARKVTFEGFPPLQIDEQWIVPAGNRLPAFYPEDIPFLAGFACRMMNGGGHFMALWRDDACPVADLARNGSSSPAADGHSTNGETSDGGFGSRWLRDAMPQIREHRSGEHAAEWMGAQAAEFEAERRYVDAFVHLAEATLFDGWTEVRQKGPVAFAVRSLLAEKGQRRRLITLSGAMGQTTLGLTEGPPSALP